jgi:hypothetical protein
VLTAQCEVERAAHAAPASQVQLASVLEWSRTIAALAGRIALFANPVHRFLATHDRQFVVADVERLRGRAAAATDPKTQAALDRAIAARTRQIATHDQLIANETKCSRVSSSRALRSNRLPR